MIGGANRCERAETRTNQRNGHRPRLWTTQAGDIELKIPKLAHGSFFPSLLAPRGRIDQALHAVIMQAYIEGVSTRSVDDLVQALGIESGIGFVACGVFCLVTFTHRRAPSTLKAMGPPVSKLSADRASRAGFH